MPRTTVLAAGAGGSVTFNRDALGVSVETLHHTVTVEAGVTTFDVDVRVGGIWIRPASCTDVAEADAVVLRQIGFDAVKVTCTGAGDVTLTSWKDPS